MFRLYFLCFLFLITGQTYAGNDFYKGFWQFDVSMEVNGFITKKHLKRISYCVRELNQLISLFKPMPNCEISGVEKNANSLSWQLYCANEGGAYSGQAIFTRHDNIMDGDIQLTSILQGVGSVMQTHYTIKGKFEPLCEVNGSSD